MIPIKRTQRDAYLFLRTRAAQLLDEGREQQAKKLLTRIDQEQIRMIQADVTAMKKVVNR